MPGLVLSILHISDLHVRSEEGPDDWRRQRVLGQAWADNVDALLEDGPLDLICFTGDLASSGKAEQYATLTPFVTDLLKQVKLTPDRLFVVPGNHDIDRSVATAAWKKLRALDHDDAPALSEWMAGGKPLRGIRKAYCDEILKRQAAYRAWVRDALGRPELLPDPKQGHPRLGYRVTLAGWPCPIHVIGLDSAWLCGDDGDARKLWLTDAQIGRLADNLSGFRIALMHHPLAELADEEECRRLLADRVNLLLRGHRHDAEASLWSDPGRRLRERAAGCLYEHDKYKNGCQRIDIHFDKHGQPARIQTRFRAWSERGHWYDDGSTYREAPNGRLVEVLSDPASERVVHAGAAGIFVGRENELRALEEALLTESGAVRPVAIAALEGMAGVGKSYLADRFAHEHKERFPGGYLKLSLSPDEKRTPDELGSALADKLKLGWGPGAWEMLRERIVRSEALVHIENADGEPSAKATAEIARRLHGCAVIVSGRYRGLGDAAGWKRVEIAPFEEWAALEQLKAELKRSFDRPDLVHLARQLGYLPLALHLAAGYLNHGRSIKSFLGKFHKDKLATRPHSPADPLLLEDESRAIVSRTFELSLELLKKTLKGHNAKAQLAGFARLGHAPPSGFGPSLGAAIAGLAEDAFEDLMAAAADLSLANLVPEQARPNRAWSVHPLLAALLRAKLESDTGGIDGMTDWFVTRLPELPAGDEDEQGRRWKEIQAEGDALAHWLKLVPTHDAVGVERAGSRYAMRNGPFPAWLAFCERILPETDDPAVQSDVLWTLCQVTRRSGALERAMAAAEAKARIDRGRGAARDAALSAGAMADILMARGQLDEALRIHREEVLPVVERLGDVRSRAVTLGKIADILEAQEQRDEALRILREEVLPVFERLGDVRERTLTLGKIADILGAQGQLGEALRIRCEEELPVYERLGDVRSRALTSSQIADILGAQGQLDEALRILREEVLPVVERLGAVRDRTAGHTHLAILYLKRGRPEDRDEAVRVLELALRDAETMQIPEAEQIRAILAKVRG